MNEPIRLRLFVALELPAEWREALAREARGLESAAPGFGRWVDPALMHVTLVFLGSQDAGVLPAIEQAVGASAAGSAPFTLRLGAPGAFGGRHALRVIWVGVEDQPAGALARLHRALAAQLAAARVSFDAAPFRAHVTLGRARRDATAPQSERMYTAIERRKIETTRRRTDIDMLHCDEVTVMRSELRRTGPIYTPLYRARLAAEPRAERLDDASRRVRDESMRVNAEFSAIEQDFDPE